MNALAMVAHPDDCVIFAWSFIHHHPRLTWKICYLTYHAQDDRARDIARFWEDKGIALHFLGHVDRHHDLETGRCSFDVDQAAKDILEQVQDQQVILTHDHRGDYGHLHHKFVHDVVTRYHEHVVTFADTQSGNVEYVIENADYSALDIHRSIVQSFHAQAHRNRYSVPGCVQQMIKEYHI